MSDVPAGAAQPDVLGAEKRAEPPYEHLTHVELVALALKLRRDGRRRDVSDPRYVVVEFNQASGRPRIASATGLIYDSLEDALNDVRMLADVTPTGRADTFEVYEIRRVEARL